MTRRNFDFVVVGAGIFGMSTAYSLNKRGYSVCLLSEGEIPNTKASSHDMSKILRLEYGDDQEYMLMAERSLVQWREWNADLGEKTFHETGFLLLGQKNLQEPSQKFERDSLALLESRGFETQRLNSSKIAKSFPAFNSSTFVDGFYNRLGGFADSARLLQLLSEYLEKKGVIVRANSKVSSFESNGNKVNALRLDSQESIQGSTFICCAGCYTPNLLDMTDSFSITAHPSFHLRCPEKMLEKFSVDHFPVFSADISNTGWYGFPIIVMNPFESCLLKHSDISLVEAHVTAIKM